MTNLLLDYTAFEQPRNKYDKYTEAGYRTALQAVEATIKLFQQFVQIVLDGAQMTVPVIILGMVSDY